MSDSASPRQLTPQTTIQNTLNDTKNRVDHGRRPRFSENGRVPRANIVFEAGYLMSLHGPGRTVIEVQDGTTLLADLGGYTYIALKG